MRREERKEKRQRENSYAIKKICDKKRLRKKDEKRQKERESKTENLENEKEMDEGKGEGKALHGNGKRG